MKRVVVFGNSMSMPRPWLIEDERTTIDDVYGTLLRRRLAPDAEVEIAFVNSLDSENAGASFHQMVSLRQPDVVILHIGIIDCAPRLFRKGSRHLFLQPWFRKASGDLGMRFMRRFRRRITRWRKIVYVKPARFERNLYTVLEKMREFRRDTRVICVSIAEVSDSLDERNYGYIANIREYNEILRRVFGDDYVEVNGLLHKERLLISDGYHFTAEGHRALADALAERIGAV